MLHRQSPDPTVHGVDRNCAGIVDQEVKRPRASGQDDAGSSLRVEGDPHRAGEIVAGPQWQQSEHDVVQEPSLPQLLHQDVEGAVAPRCHQRSTGGTS